MRIKEILLESLVFEESLRLKYLKLELRSVWSVKGNTLCCIFTASFTIHRLVVSRSMYRNWSQWKNKQVSILQKCLQEQNRYIPHKTSWCGFVLYKLDLCMDWSICHCILNVASSDTSFNLMCLFMSSYSTKL